MKNFHPRWVPHELTDNLQQVRDVKYGELLRALEDMQRTHSRHIPAGDESWFYLEYQHASQWLVSRDEVPQRVDPAIGTAEFMLTVIWGVKGPLLLDLMPSQCRFKAQYFVEHGMMPLVQTVFPQGRTQYTPRLNFHLKNCRVNFSKVTEQFLIENQLLHVPCPPYSPDLALSDFWLFARIKTELAGRSFTEPEELLEGVREFMEEFLLQN
jgi:histone-lysine N-methyltransferase SETMAR